MRAAASDFLQCTLFPVPSVLEKAAITAQQPCFSTKFALCQKPLTQSNNNKKKRNPLFVYYLLLGTISSLAPKCQCCTFTRTTTKHGQAGDQGGDRRKETAQAGTELRSQCLQKNSMAAKKNRLAISTDLPCSGSLPASPIPFPKSWLSSMSPVVCSSSDSSAQRLSSRSPTSYP